MTDRSKPRRTQRDGHNNVVGLFSRSPVCEAVRFSRGECDEKASGLIWSVVLIILALVWLICAGFALVLDHWWPYVAAAVVTYIMLWRA